MAYENINTSKLNSALNKAELSLTKLNNLKGSFNSNKWDSVARKKVEKAVDDLISLYKDFNNKVASAKNIKDKIKKVKELQDDNNSYRYWLNYYKARQTNFDGTTNEYSRDKVWYYQNKINVNNQTINNLKNQIEGFL